MTNILPFIPRILYEEFICLLNHREKSQTYPFVRKIFGGQNGAGSVAPVMISIRIAPRQKNLCYVIFLLRSLGLYVENAPLDIHVPSHCAYLKCNLILRAEVCQV